MAGRLDIEAYQGDDFRSDPVQFLRGDTPVDLTNMVGKCQVRQYLNSGLITELNAVIDDAKNGIYHLEATAEIMKLLPTNKETSDLVPFGYDVQWTSDNGFKQTTTYGILYIRPEVTK